MMMVVIVHLLNFVFKFFTRNWNRTVIGFEKFDHFCGKWCLF